MALLAPTGDFVTSTLNGAITAAATSMTIGTGLTLPATNGVLQIDYDSSTAVGADNGPETITYTSYNSGTGAVSGMTRGADGFTTGVAHANGAKVQCGPSSMYFGQGLYGNADLNTTAGEPGGAWKAWTPVWTNLTVSGSTVAAKYTQIGKTIHYRISVTLGGGNAPSGSVTFTLPISSIAQADTNFQIGRATFVDTGTASYDGMVFYNTATTGLLRAPKADGTYIGHVALSATIPHAWANTDLIHITGTYEAA